MPAPVGNSAWLLAAGLRRRYEGRISHVLSSRLMWHHSPCSGLRPGNGLGGRRGVSSGRKPRPSRARRREEERQEDARYRRLLARARTLAFEPEELDEAIRQEPRLLDVVLTSRHAARRALFGCCPELLPAQGRTGLVLLGGAGDGEAVGVGASLDDVAAEGEAVDDGGAEAGVGEGLGPAAEGLVGGDRDAKQLARFAAHYPAVSSRRLIQRHCCATRAERSRIGRRRLS